MNKLLEGLGEICKMHPLCEKRLVVPSYSAGRVLCESLARGGGGWLNLHPVTVTGLAQEIVGLVLADNRVSFLNNYLVSTVVEEVFLELRESGQLAYLNIEGDSGGIVSAVSSALLQMRKAGISSGALSREAFKNAFDISGKGSDLKALLAAYERYLAKRGYIDAPGLLMRALDVVYGGQQQERSPSGGGIPAWQEPDNLPGVGKTPARPIYILPAFIEMHPLERQFIERLAGDRLLLLKADPVYGLGSKPAPDAPVSTPTDAETARSDVLRLPWLYSLENCPKPVGDGSLTVFHAYGMRNEAKEVLRRIVEEDIPFDRVTVAYTSGEYATLFYTLARRMGVRITISEGVPLSFTGPGRVLQGLVKWVQSGYSIEVFQGLFACGDAEVKNDSGNFCLDPSAAVRILRRSGIGWGRKRYDLLKTIPATQANVLYKFFAGLLKSLPEPTEGRYDFGQLTGAFADILPRVAKTRGVDDANALTSLVSALQQMGRLATFSLTADEALERVGNLAADLRIGASEPKPGHLHLTNYAGVVWSNRPYTFFVGLDAANFPGSGHQDPLLLDKERTKLHPGLPLGAERPAQKLYLMALALASRRGKVTLSYPSYDIIQNRTNFPSALLLQACRLLVGNKTLDYTGLAKYLGEPAGYCPAGGKKPLDELEWWIGKALRGSGLNNREGLAAVIGGYRNLGAGSVAGLQRAKDELTEYDGWVAGEGSHFDPRNKEQSVLSSSRIEELAGCPFAYFLRYILKIEPPEEVGYNPECWLGALERGSMLHELFYRFMKTAMERGEKPSVQKHSGLIKEIACHLIGEYRLAIPPPSETVFEREVADIIRCCELFLKGEEIESADGEGRLPLFFEIPFGLGPEAVRAAGYGLSEPLMIDLANDTFFMLRGKIDRIDRLRDGTYSVLDYKTGGAGGYDESKYLFRGRQVQHALYSVAAKEIIGRIQAEKAEVTLSGYYFPTEKGEGRRVMRLQAGQAVLNKALGHLFDLLAAGLFIPAEDGYRCTFCDYQNVCGYPASVEKSKQLIGAAGEEAPAILRPWKELMIIG